MKEFEGTKGNWSYSQETGTIRGEGGLLAELLINGSEDDNGALMAAAPELLEALRQLRDYVEDTYPTKEYGYAWAAESHPMSLARAAITKALGKD